MGKCGCRHALCVIMPHDKPLKTPVFYDIQSNLRIEYEVILQQALGEQQSNCQVVGCSRTCISSAGAELSQRPSFQASKRHQKHFSVWKVEFDRQSTKSLRRGHISSGMRQGTIQSTTGPSHRGQQQPQCRVLLSRRRLGRPAFRSGLQGQACRSTR